MEIINKIVDFIFLVTVFVIGWLNILIFGLFCDFSNYLNHWTSRFHLDKEYNKLLNKIVDNVKIVEIKNQRTEIKFVINYDTIINARIYLSNNKKLSYNKIKVRNVRELIEGLLKEWKKIKKVEFQLLKNWKVVKTITYTPEQIKQMFNL